MPKYCYTLTSPRLKPPPSTTQLRLDDVMTVKQELASLQEQTDLKLMKFMTFE